MLADVIVAPVPGLPALRDGHWYTTSREIPGAHATPDGHPVGIFCRAETVMVPATVDGKVVLRPHQLPDRVVFQGPDGHDLLVDVGAPLKVRCELPIDRLPDLQPLDEFDDLPESRKATSWLKAGARLTALP